MKKHETIGVIEMIRRAYPRFIEPSPHDTDIKKAVSGVVDLWHEFFGNESAAQVVAAVRAYIAQSRFPPTIADIRAIVDQQAGLPTPGSVWQEALRLFDSPGLTADFPEKAYARMSPACRAGFDAAGGWYSVCMSPEGDREMRRAFDRGVTEFLARERAQRTMAAQTAPALPEVRP